MKDWTTILGIAALVGLLLFAAGVAGCANTEPMPDNCEMNGPKDKCIPEPEDDCEKEAYGVYFCGGFRY